MVARDIFLQYRPFITEPKNYYEAHYHEILASALFYHVLYLSSPVISKALFGDNYRSLSRKGKKNFDIHIVSMVQCLISIAVIIPLYGNEYLAEDPIFHYLPYAGFVSAITIGYFIWDFFELSTPFVNVNWFVSKLPAGTVPFYIQAINGLLLMITFFIVRIIWGFYAIYKVSGQLYAVRDQLPLWLPLIIVGLNFGLDALNVYWFKKMVAIAAKKFSGSSSQKKVE
ncbi:unnamed protein product [Wickerhamomyces anomalus]